MNPDRAPPALFQPPSYTGRGMSRKRQKPTFIADGSSIQSPRRRGRKGSGACRDYLFGRESWELAAHADVVRWPVVRLDGRAPDAVVLSSRSFLALGRKAQRRRSSAQDEGAGVLLLVLLQPPDLRDAHSGELLLPAIE